MKHIIKYVIFILVISSIVTSCVTPRYNTKFNTYPKMYNEKPLSIVLMPPINRSTNVDAKEYFQNTLNIPMANLGYYVFPNFLTTEILKQESAYDSELFLNASVSKFGEIMGADALLFTIIHAWDKDKLFGKIYVSVEYVLKSTKTNEILFARKGSITYDTSIKSGTNSGIAGLIVSAAATMINTSLTKYIGVARSCNNYTLKDLPHGKYSPVHMSDTSMMVGETEFSKILNQNSR